MIISAAILTEKGKVYVGKRHGDCHNQMKDMNLDRLESLRAEQGFLNDNLNFLTREEAYYEAYECNQCTEKSFQNKVYAEGLKVKKSDWRPLLMSEDLW